MPQFSLLITKFFEKSLFPQGISIFQKFTSYIYEKRIS